MKKFRFPVAWVCFLWIMLTGCFPKKSAENHKKETDTIPGSGEITLAPLKMTTLYEDAMLEMNEPGEFRRVLSGKVRFSYEVINFKLGKQIREPVSGGLAFRSSGSHITTILNNILSQSNPGTEFYLDLKEGHYTVLAFLSQSDFISLKSPDAYVIRQFTCGRAKARDLDLTGPNLFYSMPSGSFYGKETENVLLDFYLINCRLSPDGFKVKVTVNNRTKIITDWSPYIIHGLPYGESTITLRLIGKNGHEVSAPYHSATRKIFLYEKKPA